MTTADIAGERAGIDIIPRLGSVVILTSLLAMLFSHMIHPMRIGYDQAKYVLVADLIWQGKTLYVDMIDLNPPAISYISLIPSLMTRLFQMPAPLAFSLFIWTLCLYCTGMTWLLAIKAKPKVDGIILYSFIASQALYNLILTTNGLWVLFEFGQREHIYILTYLPFFFLRWLRWQGLPIARPLTIPIGLLAGCGMCIKPYFLIPAIISELVYWIENRKVRHLFTLENVFAALALIVYAVHFNFLPPDARKAYLETIVPLVVLGYQFYDRTTIYLVNYHFTNSYLTMFRSMSGIALLFPLAKLNPLLLPIGIIVLGAYFVYFIQGKGFPLHMLPLNFYTFILACTLAASVVNEICKNPDKIKEKCSAIFNAIPVARLARQLLSASHKNKAAPTPSKKQFALTAMIGKRMRRVAKQTREIALLVSSILGVYARKMGAVGVGSLALYLIAMYSIFFMSNYDLGVATRMPQFDMSRIGYHGTTTMEDMTEISETIIDGTTIGDPVAVVFDSTEPGATALLQTRRVSAFGHIDLTMLGPLHFAKDEYRKIWNQNFPAALANFIEVLIRDIKRSQPKMIFVHKGALLWMDGFQFPERVLGKYEKVGKKGEFDIYRYKER